MTIGMYIMYWEMHACVGPNNDIGINNGGWGHYGVQNNSIGLDHNGQLEPDESQQKTTLGDE